MAEPVREQVQNLNLSAQDSGHTDTQADQHDVMADTEPENQQDPNIKHTSNGETGMDHLIKGDNYDDDMYVEDSSDDDDEEDFEYSKSGNTEQRVPMSFDDYSDRNNETVEPGPPQFDGFQPFFPQGYQEDVTPPQGHSDALIDNGSASQGQLSDNSIPPTSNQEMLMDFGKQNVNVVDQPANMDDHPSNMDDQPANMQDMNPFVDSQNSQMYSNNPFMEDISRVAGMEAQVVPEADVGHESNSNVSQKPDLILMGESCQPASHDTELSNQSLSETNRFQQAQNVIDSVAQQGDTTDNDIVPVSAISPSVPEVAICDDQPRSLDSSQEDIEELHEKEIKSHDQDYKSHDQDYKSHDQDYESHDQDYKSHDQDHESHDQEYESHDQEYESHDQEFNSQEYEPHVHDFEPHDPDFKSHDQLVESSVQPVESHDQHMESRDQQMESLDQQIDSHEQKIESEYQQAELHEPVDSYEQELDPQGQKLESYADEYGVDSRKHEMESYYQQTESHDQLIDSHKQEMEVHGQKLDSYDDHYGVDAQEQDIESQDDEYDIESQDEKCGQLEQTKDICEERNVSDVPETDKIPGGPPESEGLLEDKPETMQDITEDDGNLSMSSEPQLMSSKPLFSKQIESPEEDMNARCMGLIEPTQIVPEEEVSQDAMQQVDGNEAEVDQRCHSPDEYLQPTKTAEGVNSVEGSQECQVNDVSKTPVDVSSSDDSQPPFDARESGMTGSFILESGQTLDEQNGGEYQNEVSKSLTQDSSDEGEAEDLDVGISNQMSRSGLEDSIILDDGETFDDKAQFGNEMTGSMVAESEPQQEIVPPGMDDKNQAMGEIASEMSRSLMEDSIVLGEGETFDKMQVSDERIDVREGDDRNIENDFVPQNGIPQHQEIPDIHYQAYDSQSGKIIEMPGQDNDEQGEGEDYIDDISSEESQDHLETSQRLAEEVSEHKDFTQRHPSELELQQEMDHGYFEQGQDMDTPGDVDEHELYEQEQGYEQDVQEPLVAEEPIHLGRQVHDENVQQIEQQAESKLIDFGFEEQNFEQVSEPVAPSEPAPLIDFPSQEVKSFEKETVVAQIEAVKTESVSKIPTASEVTDKPVPGSPKKTDVKAADKKKEEKAKPKKPESATKKAVPAKTTPKPSPKPKSATPREDVKKTPSPTKPSAPKPSSTITRRSPPKSAEPTRSKTTPSTGTKTERPATVATSTPRRPVSADIAAKKNAIPLRKSLPSPVKSATPDKKSPVSATKKDTTQTSPTKREITPRAPPKPRPAPSPRTKKDASSDSGVEEDKSTRKSTTVTQKKKAATTTTTQKTTTTSTVRKTETKNGPLTDSRKSSPGTSRTGVASKIGSMDNARHSPGGGNVKITTKKTDYSTVGSRIGSKANLEHRPGGGEKKVLTQKLEWKTGSRIGSLDNAKHSPGGGNVKILNEKVDWKTQSRIGSLDNAKHSPGGGNVKIKSEKLQWDAKSKCGSLDNATHVPGGGDVKIESKKLEFDKVQSRVGSKDNIKHHAGGGEKKIETQKIDFREKASSKVGSKDNIKHHAGGGEKKIETQKLTFREKAKPKTDTGASPLPGAKSPPPENGVAEQTTAAQ